MNNQFISELRSVLHQNLEEHNTSLNNKDFEELMDCIFDVITDYCIEIPTLKNGDDVLYDDNDAQALIYWKSGDWQVIKEGKPQELHTYWDNSKIDMQPNGFPTKDGLICMLNTIGNKSQICAELKITEKLLDTLIEYYGLES